jgi:DNA-binding MarR family transcriptional regulator
MLLISVQHIDPGVNQNIMAELSYQLKTLEPLTGALDIIRYLDSLDDPVAGIDDILAQLDLSERAFSKAIRRLVTKGYVQMDGNQVYRLTESGQEAADEIADYDGDAPVEAAPVADTPPQTTARTVSRRMVMALPHALTAGQPANVIVGFHPDINGGASSEPLDMILRLSTVNGEPAAAQDESLQLSGDSAQHSFQVVAGDFTKVRIRLQAFQLGPGPDDISVAGGMYVDVDVVTDNPSTDLVAYGADITLTVEE